MIAATLVGIIFIPALFALFESIKEYFYPAPAKNNLDTSSSPTEPRSELSEENAKSDLQPLEKNTKLIYRLLRRMQMHKYHIFYFHSCSDHAMSAKSTTIRKLLHRMMFKKI